MKKLFKGILILTAVVCSVLCMTFAAGCDETVEEGYYKVTVQLEGGKPATGVLVGMCSNDGKLGCTTPKAVGSDGSILVDIKSYIAEGTTSFNIHVSNLPDGYAYVDENNEPYDENDPSDGLTVKLSEGNKKVVTLVAWSE